MGHTMGCIKWAWSASDTKLGYFWNSRWSFTTMLEMNIVLEFQMFISFYSQNETKDNYLISVHYNWQKSNDKIFKDKVDKITSSCLKMSQSSVITGFIKKSTDNCVQTKTVAVYLHQTSWMNKRDSLSAYVHFRGSQELHCSVRRDQVWSPPGY